MVKLAKGLLPNYLYFNRKKYGFNMSFGGNKRSADAAARSHRKQGYKARVVARNISGNTIYCEYLRV